MRLSNITVLNLSYEALKFSFYRFYNQMIFLLLGVPFADFWCEYAPLFLVNSLLCFPAFGTFNYINSYLGAGKRENTITYNN